jgi:Protein of unknown function (DUF4232)
VWVAVAQSVRWRPLSEKGIPSMSLIKILPRWQIATVVVASSATIASLWVLGPSGSHASPTRAASVRKCATSHLVVWLDLPGNGTAGSTYYTLQFTNLSSRECLLRGYPGVSAVTLAGHQLGAGAGHSSLQKFGTVTLAPDATVTAVLRITDPGALPPTECHETLAAGIRVYPPGQTSARLVPFPFLACSRKDRSNITTSPVGPFREE